MSFSAMGDQPAVLDTAESIVIDGANGVTRASRQGFPDASWAVGVAIVVAVIVVAIRRVRPALALPIIAAGLSLACLPGLVQVFFERADAPLRRPNVAGVVRSTLAVLAASAPWPAPIEVVHEDDDVLFPLGRYAVPVRALWQQPEARQLVIRGNRLQLSCSTPAQGQPVTCEAPK